MSGTGFTATQGDWKTGQKGVSSWARAEAGSKPLVTTSSGHTVDFWTRNFDVKHLMLVENASSFPALVSDAIKRQQLRESKALLGHDGKPVMKYHANSAVVLTPNGLASWGALIVRHVQATAPHVDPKFGAQWHVTARLPGAAYFTHSSKGAPSGGMGATVTVTCTKSGTTIFVVHLGTKPTESFHDGKRGLDLSGGSGPFTEAEAKRRARFLQSTDTTEPDYGAIGSLFN